MDYIQTVTGRFPTENLEITLIHEHILIGYAGWFYDPRTIFDKKKAINAASIRFEQLKEHGVNCFVDPTPIELGRNVDFLQEISEKTGIQVVCSTGFDLETRGFLSAFRNYTAADIYEIYLMEIEEGIGEAKIKPGVIKVATGNGHITEYEENCIKAASMASVKSGLPIITHTEKGTMGPEQIRLFKKFGVNPLKCLIGHCCANSDLRYHKKIFDEGAFVGFDRFGNDWHGEDYFRLGTLTALLHMGFSSQLFISCDSVAYWLGRPPEKRDSKNWDPLYIFQSIIPQLKERGVSANCVENMLRKNAKRFFQGE